LRTKRKIYFYLQLPWRDTTLEDEISLLQSIVKTIRSIRQEYNLTRAKPEGISPSVLSVCIGHALNVGALMLLLFIVANTLGYT